MPDILCPNCGYLNRSKKPKPVSCPNCKRYYEPRSGRQFTLYMCSRCGYEHRLRENKDSIGQRHLDFKVGDYR